MENLLAAPPTAEVVEAAKPHPYADSDYVEVDCIHWRWPSGLVSDAIDVPHWITRDRGESK